MSMDLAEEEYIFSNLIQGYSRGFVEVTFIGDDYPRFLKFENDRVILHASGGDDAWHFSPGEIVSVLDHISLVSMTENEVVLSFNNQIKNVALSNTSPGVYWGR